MYPNLVIFPKNFVFELGYKRSYKRFEALNVENYRFNISMSQILRYFGQKLAEPALKGVYSILIH